MVTATPSAKDVVVVIDKSGSMSTRDYRVGQNLMTIAKNAATSVIETLNPNDRVSIFYQNKLATVQEVAFKLVYSLTIFLLVRPHLEQLFLYLFSIL